MDQTLDQMLAGEEAEINELLKKAGVDTDPTGIIDNGEAETVPPPAESTTDLQAETAEPIKEPEPEKPPEPIKEPEPEPEPPKEAKRQQPWGVWKTLRDTERRMRELEAENLRLKSQPPPQPRQEQQYDQYESQQATIDELDEKDPITKLRVEQDEIKRQLAEQIALNQQNRSMTSIQADEMRFKQDHADYEQALGFLTQRARQRMAATGEIEEKMQEVLQKHQEVIQNVLHTKGVQTPTDDQVYQTAEDIAFAILFEGERQRFVGRAQAQGRSVAAAAYQLAQSEGYRTQTVEEPASAPPPPQKSAADLKADAQKRVQRQADLAKANQSLSAMQNSGAPRSLMVKTKAEFMRMSPEQQDKLIEQMEEVDPDWHQKLAD